jgi:hypothetical protein
VFPEEGVWRVERARILDERARRARPGTEAGLARRGKPATRRREPVELNLIMKANPGGPRLRLDIFSPLPVE